MTAKELISDVLIVAGAASIGWGLWQIFPPATWLFEGSVALWFGWMLGTSPPPAPRHVEVR